MLRDNTFSSEKQSAGGRWVEWPVAVERLWKVAWGRPVEDVEMQLRTGIAHGWLRAVEATDDGAPAKRIDKADFFEYDAPFDGEVEQCVARRPKPPDWYDSCVRVSDDDLSNFLISGNEARAIVEKALGYPADAAADWVLRNIVERRVWAWHGSQLICHSRLDMGGRLKCFIEGKPSLPLAALLIVKKTLVQALKGETAAPAAAVEEFREHDPETACQGWRESEMRKPPRRPAGALAKWDWSAFEESFVEEVKTRGFPDKLNEEGWRTQADVARWVLDLPDFTRSGPAELPSLSTIKGYARRWMDNHAHLANGS